VTPVAAKRVMIVEDSGVVRAMLEHIVAGDPRLALAASVESGEAALARLETVRPDVISLDIRLPGIDGFVTTRRVMQTLPTPIVVVSGSVEKADLRIAMRALEAGALAVVEKPVGTTNADYAAVARRICDTLVAMSEVRVLRQKTPSSVAPRDPAPASAVPGAMPPERPVGVVALVASTGGPAALARVIGDLGPVAVPVVVAQHITPAFVGGFADWLGQVTGTPAAVGRDGEALVAGRVHVAPADRHLAIASDGRLRTRNGVRPERYTPSGDVLLRSVAESLGGRAIAAVLTGMGADGAEGLAALRAAGGYTLAQDRATAVVYGMPRAAVERGGVIESLPVEAIGGRIRRLLAAGGTR
jgi:two-component system, chemotaxis family, protein-glutamate methylesterase/glutaminase